MTSTATRPALAATILAGDIHRASTDRGLWATTDGGGTFTVIATTEAGVIVRGYRTGTLARIVQTGQAVKHGQVRVRFEFATDLGDVAGTLAFDGTRCGGVAPLVAFA